MDRYRCLTCYLPLVEDEYYQHKTDGHVTIEYVELEDDDDED